MAQPDSRTGHRARLRQRFLTNPTALSEAQILELLLTFAIPRRDVAPLARTLIERFESVDQVLTLSYKELVAVPGIGERAATLIKLVAQLTNNTLAQAKSAPDAVERQPALFEVEPELGPLFDSQPQEPQMRAFVNDEIANALTFVPQAAQFETFEAFKAYLGERLPYNSASTRHRRANYILNRFFPQERLDIPLVYYAANCSSQQNLKPALFYHVLKAEPIAAKVAEEFIWPALPTGRVDRQALREFILSYLPDIGASSQKNTLRSLFTTYDLLAIGVREDATLRFQIHTGSLEGFLYVLTAEFSQPGIYTFEALENSPLRHWLLWDREWMQQQLYNLRDFGILTKISEIDTVRQFTVQFDQGAALRYYFEHPRRDTLALRERLAPNGDEL
jgi:DNA repair protein RadC